MKELLTNPVILNLEVNLVEHLIQIVSNAIRHHNDEKSNQVLNALIDAKNKAQLLQPEETIKEDKNAT